MPCCHEMPCPLLCVTSFMNDYFECPKMELEKFKARPGCPQGRGRVKGVSCRYLSWPSLSFVNSKDAKMKLENKWSKNVPKCFFETPPPKSSGDGLVARLYSSAKNCIGNLFLENEHWTLNTAWPLTGQGKLDMFGIQVVSSCQCV